MLLPPHQVFIDLVSYVLLVLHKLVQVVILIYCVAVEHDTQTQETMLLF